MSDIPNSKQIHTYFYCSQCLNEAVAKGEAPLDYQRIAFGLTPMGLQLWCCRHNMNVMHVDFGGRDMRANVTATRPETAVATVLAPEPTSESVPSGGKLN